MEEVEEERKTTAEAKVQLESNDSDDLVKTKDSEQHLLADIDDDKKEDGSCLIFAEHS